MTSPADAPSPRARAEWHDRDTIRVLHVDDDPSFGDVAATFLERADDRLDVDTAAGAEAGLAALGERRYDCVVSDYDMPGTDGIEFLESVREDRPDLPFVLFTGKGSEAVASEAISAGVSDYLQKEAGTSQYEVLANRLVNLVERYRSERALKAHRERLSLFFDQSPLGVIEWDRQFRFARVNGAAEDILGYDEDELVGRSWEYIVPETEREEVADVVTDLLSAEGGYRSLNENVRGDGERIVCEWHNRVVTDDDGNVVAVFSQFQDVTDRERHRRALERREERFRRLAASATDAILTIDAESIIRYANPAVERVFGYEADELLGEPLTVLMPEHYRDRHLAAVKRYLETGERRLDWEAVELPGRHRDGHELDLRVSFAELETDEGRRFTGIVRRVTDDPETPEP